MAPRRPHWPLLIAATGVGVVLAWLFFAVLRPHDYAGAVLLSPDSIPEMENLEYDNGEPVSIEALRGDVLLIYFGYVNCPDLCPTTLATVARALDILGTRADDIQTLMVTVDPARDPPEMLGEFVRHFDEGFRGVWGIEDDVLNVATLYGIYVEYEEPDEDGNYLVGHTASLFAIDREGFAKVAYPVGVSPRDLAGDLKVLLG